MTIRVFDISKTPMREPCWVALQWCHNHPLNSLEVNTFRDILPETAEKVKSYFDSGFSPGLARDQFLKELKESCDSELQFLIKCRDRSISPRRPDYNRLYSDYCKEKYGDRNGVGMFAHLSDVIKAIN